MIDRKQFIWLLAVVLGMILSSCSQRALREALNVTAQADSLRAEGQIYSDSVQLSNAYNTLTKWQLFHSDDYAHCCYHYGRLLREKDDPVSAMRVFINATHSHTDDLHILGRVYSNMGDICHLAGDFPLSYDMFERSTNMFLQGGDTLLYYYGLNNMAYELAEQKMDDETNAILNTLTLCPYSSIQDNLHETKIILYRNNQQYDSIIEYTNSIPITNSTFILISKAQAFFHLEEYDSAAYYAQNTLDRSDKLFEQDNAYYILIHCDSVKSGNNVYALNASRADVEKEIEIRHGNLKQAVQLLEQDLNRKPNLWWLYSIISTLVVVGIGIVLYVYRKRKRKELLTQKIDILEGKASAMQEKHNELTERYLTEHKRIEEIINERCSMLQTDDSIRERLAWKNYKRMCGIVDKQFYLLASKLREKYSLKEIEVRICILTLLDCKYDQMAELLYRSSTSIGTLKMRVANKLGTTSKEMRKYIIDNVCFK